MKIETLLDLDFIPHSGQEPLNILIIGEDCPYIEDILLSCYKDCNINYEGESSFYDLILVLDESIVSLEEIDKEFNYFSLKYVFSYESLDNILDFVKDRSYAYKIGSKYFLEEDITIYVLDYSTDTER